MSFTPTDKLQFVGAPVGKKTRKLNLQRQLHFHQPSHPDFPATEPDDRVNGMAVRAVHVAEVHPEESEPLDSDAEGIKKLQPLIFKGCAMAEPVGFEPTSPSPGCPISVYCTGGSW